MDRGLLDVSLFTLTAFIHLWLRKARLGALDATEILRQSDSLAEQNAQLEALVATATRDIAVREEADKHLAQMEARYRGLLEAAPDAMVVVDQAGAIVLLNLQAEKQFGYRRDELVGQQVKTVIPKGFAERLIADDARTAAEALAQQIGTGLELIGRRKDGSEFPMELMLSPLESDEGNPGHGGHSRHRRSQAGRGASGADGGPVSRPCGKRLRTPWWWSIRPVRSSSSISRQRSSSDTAATNSSARRSRTSSRKGSPNA